MSDSPLSLAADVAMVQLSDLQLAQLLEEIAYAVNSGRPVSEAMNRLRSRRFGIVGRAAGDIAKGLERGEGISTVVGATIGRRRSRVAAAILASDQCGDARLIARVARQLRRRSEFARDWRLAWLYPLILLLVGYAVAIGVMAPTVRRIHGDEMRWSDPIVRLAFWLETGWWIPPLVLVGVAALFFVGRATRNAFPKPARYGLFCGSLADQFRHQVPEDRAIRAAATIAGDRSLMALKSPSLSTPEVARVLAPSQAFLTSDATPESDDATIARLRYLAVLYGERARQVSRFWSSIVPRCAMVVIGGGLILTYVWCVIAPVYQQVARW